MVGLLIVTHGPLANAFKESARMFFDEVADRIQTIGLYPGDTIEDLEGKITNAICNRYDEDGMMVFVDMLAGSPFNMTALTLQWRWAAISASARCGNIKSRSRSPCSAN